MSENLPRQTFEIKPDGSIVVGFTFDHFDTHYSADQLRLSGYTAKSYAAVLVETLRFTRHNAIEFPSGSVLTTKAGYITGRVEPEVQRAPLPDSDAWRYTGKQRDDFADFTVNSSEAIDYILPTTRPAPQGSTLHAHPGMGAALLRG